jgi:hypothetical protein
MQTKTLSSSNLTPAPVSVLITCVVVTLLAAIVFWG